MVKKYLEDKKDLSRLARETIDLHPRGYKGVVVEGDRGSGKTVFCLKTQREVYQYHYGISRDDAWERVLKDIIFDMDDIIRMLDNLDRLEDHKDNMQDWWDKEVHICRVWDDAGMHGGKYKYQSDPKLVSFLQQNMDVMRFIVTGFYINSPELGNLLMFLRDYHDHTIIKITHNPAGSGEYEKLAFFQRWKRARNRNAFILVRDPPHQPFSNFLGNVPVLQLSEQWVYDEYEYLKGLAIKRNKNKFKEMLAMALKSNPNCDPFVETGIPEEYVE